MRTSGRHYFSVNRSKPREVRTVRYRNHLFSTFILFIVSASAYASSSDRWLSFEQARALLADRGWQMQRGAEGDLLFAVQSAARHRPHHQDSRLAHRGAWSAVQEFFASRGWHADLAADGSLLLYPQQRQQGDGVSPVATGSTFQPKVNSHPSASPGFDKIRGYLEPLGWRVELERDGSLLLFPGHNRPKGNQYQAPTPVQEIASGQRNNLNKTDGYLKLKSSMESSGWSVDRGANPSVLLSAPVQRASRTLLPVTSLAIGSNSRRFAVDRFSGLRTTLERAGWRVRRDVNGDTLLFPGPSVSTRA